MNNEESKKQILGFDWIVVVTFLPAYIYFCSYLYEVGFCNRNGIPRYLISPNLSSILIFASSILTVLFYSVKTMGLSAPLIRRATSNDEKRAHLRPIYMLNAIVIIFAAVILAEYPITWQLILIILAYAVVLNLFQWGFGMIVLARKKESAKDKLIIIQTTPDDFDITQYLVKNLNKQQRLTIFVLILVSLASFFLGDGEALKQKFYQTVIAKPNVVVLRKYDNTLVCSYFDRKSKILQDTILLIEIKGDSLRLHTENLGHLSRK